MKLNSACELSNGSGNDGVVLSFDTKDIEINYLKKELGFHKEQVAQLNNRQNKLSRDIHILQTENGRLISKSAVSELASLAIPKKRVASAQKKYGPIIKTAVKKYGSGYPEFKKYLFVTMFLESGFSAQAVSNKDAQGLMQIMPFNFDWLGIDDPFDPRQNILGGAKHLRYLLDLYDGNYFLAFAAYNSGQGRVSHNKGAQYNIETFTFAIKAKLLVEYFDFEV